MKKIQNIRTDYNLYKMTRDNLLYSPIEQFKLWFSQLEYCSDFNSTTLSTYSKKNGVQSRIVLLKEIKKDGFVFYTNYNSLKAQQISQNNNVSLCFFWPQFQRQVRVQGFAFKLSERMSKSYFKQRPKQSQVAAWVSDQSSVVVNRKKLEEKFSEMYNKFKSSDVPKPKFWGGYKVKPFSIEFWQGRPDRMHDRFLYQKKGYKWTINRLCP